MKRFVPGHPSLSLAHLQPFISSSAVTFEIHLHTTPKSRPGQVPPHHLAQAARPPLKLSTEDVSIPQNVYF